MTNAENALALSDAATDYFEWLDADKHIKPFLDPSTAVPIHDGPNYLWPSVAKDVRGMPDITIQISADTLPTENVFPFDIQVSLDGRHWDIIPPSFMLIAPPGPLEISNTVVVLLLLFVRANLLRLVPHNTNGPPDASGRIVAAIVAGEA